MGSLVFLFIIYFCIFRYNSNLKRNNKAKRNNTVYNNRTQNNRQSMNPRMQSGNRSNPYRNSNPYTGFNPYSQNRNTTSAYNANNTRLSNYGSPVMPQQSPASFDKIPVNSFGLPSSQKKRSKIVSKFSERFNLCLTDSDVRSIVDASYMSTEWSREICYMNQNYENVYTWISTGNAWLKAYLVAFPRQQISSDFLMQEQIVYSTYDQIFSDVLCRPNISVSEAIQEINRKYFLQFDDVTFMIAYRFMEQKGKRYPLNLNADIVVNTSAVDDLLSKYEQTQNNGMPMH